MVSFFKSKPERVERVSRLRSGQQEDLFSQQLQAALGPGAGGASGDAADYFRSLLSGEGAEEFEAPLMRQFQEDIMPGIAEQFAGMGAGGLSSGGFAQEAGRAGTDLAERLGAIRAGLRGQGAAGLSGLVQNALSPQDELLFRPRQPGLLESFAGSAAGGIGMGIGTALGGPLGGAIGGGLANLWKRRAPVTAVNEATVGATGFIQK